eukprot:TRINITY_DN4176_c0_g4_i1.p1 TRINITY_DN4176_c0_g4~~TRINITY_DN4176_c0_g4_i1.p1  ORF type:complete len:708 (+),score=125.98 TRINITY_DN4176_c0_g4_i1:39-2162(+)
MKAPVVIILLICIIQLTATMKIPSGGYNVSYDKRSLMIDGDRVLLLSGSIHYPRSTPSMWPSIMKKTKDAGIDVVQVYVFWNRHEYVKGEYDFRDEADLLQFLQVAKDHDLFVHLRIGPYICGEWNFGGFPEWLRKVPGIAFRQYNEPFMKEMAKWMKYVVEIVDPYLARNGGPIILAQVENEYGNFEEKLPGGKKYIEWAFNYAKSLDIGVPWVMCQQGDIAGAINTCNQFFCNSWIAEHWGRWSNQPAFFTEDWPGWFQLYGEGKPVRPAQNVAFSITLFFAYGGSFANYYMWYGGTNFDRWVGGPFITTSYDYDAPIDEYGYPNEPKYTHSKMLHGILHDYEHVILSSFPKVTNCGTKCEYVLYQNSTSVITFINNFNEDVAITVNYNNSKYWLAQSSSTIVGNGYSLYNTAVFSKPAKTLSSYIEASNFEFSYWKEPLGMWGDIKTSQYPLELFDLTHDRTDYLSYITTVKGFSGKSKLQLDDTRDYVHVFVDNKYVGSQVGSEHHIDFDIELSQNNELQIVVMTMGMKNYGMEINATYSRGIRGNVYLSNKDITHQQWNHQVGLKGQQLRLYTKAANPLVQWTNGDYSNSFTWWRTSFSVVDLDKPYALDMAGMGKGFIWINGHGIGRYFNATADSGDACNKCDYANYNPYNECRIGCGGLSQRYYHVPSAWLNKNDNLLVIFEELGGDLNKVKLVQKQYWQ